MKTFKTLFVIAVVFGLMCSVGAFAAERPLRTTWAWPTYIDPAVGSDFSSSTALVNLYDTLVIPDTKGAPQPGAAERWEVASDGLSWTFYLRRGIKFHDGSDLTAEDVKFSMDRLLKIGEGYAFLFLGKIKEVKAPDKHTVVFHLNKPFGPFLSTLYRLYLLNRDLVMANIKKPGPYDDMGDYGKKFLVTRDAGSGPYMVKKFKVEQKLVLTLNPNYWMPLDPNVPDEYVMLGTTESVTVRTMMVRRELEISDQWQATETLAALKKIKGLKIAEYLSGGGFYLMIHTKKPPTDDIHFRKAMAWAMDYQTVVKYLFPGSVPSKGPIPQTVPGADPNAFQYTNNLEKAKAELKKSKYYNQLDKYPVTFHWIAEVPDEEKVAMLFMSKMTEIGINIDVVKVPWMSVVEEMAAEDTSPHIVSIFDQGHYPEAAALLDAKYGSGSAKTWEQNEWLLDKKYDAMLEDALQTMDREKRFAKYYELQKYIVDLCPTIFLFDQVEKHAYQAEYIDWPAARGELIPVMGYAMAGRLIKVYPEKRATLVK